VSRDNHGLKGVSHADHQERNAQHDGNQLHDAAFPTSLTSGCERLDRRNRA
jgi:hypothetical protein